MPEDFLNLKEYITLTIKPLEQEVASLRVAIEKLTISQIPSLQFDQLKKQVEQLSEGVKYIEERVDTLEKHDNVSTWIFRLVVTVGTALTTAYLTGLIKP